MTVNQNDPRLHAAMDAYRRGDMNKAAVILEPLILEHPNDINILQGLGAINGQRGKFDMAIAYLERARKIEPKNAHVLNMLGLAHMNIGSPVEARRHLEKAIALEPQTADAHMNLGDCLLANGETDAAKGCYEKAIAIKPDFLAALIKLASLLERQHRFEEAQTVARRAVSLAPLNGPANVTLALIDLRIGDPQQVAQDLERLIATAPMSEYDTGSIQYLIAQARNRLGEYDKAFVAYKAANNAFLQVHKPAVASTSSVLSPQFLHELNDFFANEDITGWTKPQNIEERAPIFLLGFPRSGTTLLEQILKAHSLIETVEEKETLIDARRELLQPPGALEKLRRMTDEEINNYRKKYWSHVQRELKNKDASALIIDKMPLNTILLGLIYRLFPEAKIIFVSRDPRDVVLSCFQQRFGINVATFQFLKLESAAGYYDQAMSIGDVCRTRMPLDIHFIRYEDIVGDMKKTLSDLFSFLNLKWEEEILNYRDQARSRWISTPSAEQVIEPIYASSIGKWRNYQRHLKPVLPMLEPWVKKLGYEPF